MSTIQQRIAATTSAPPSEPFKEDPTQAVEHPTGNEGRSGGASQTPPVRRRPVRSRTRRITVDLDESEYRTLRTLRTADAGIAPVVRAGIEYLAAHPEALAEVRRRAEAD